jgi:hypothetical protein
MCVVYNKVIKPNFGLTTVFIVGTFVGDVEFCCFDVSSSANTYSEIVFFPNEYNVEAQSFTYKQQTNANKKQIKLTKK